MERSDLYRIGAVLIVILMVPLTGCTDPDFVPPTKERNRWLGVGLNDTAATDQGVSEVSDSMNHFAFDLFGEVSKEGENVFISPYSIFSALSMTYEGARGDTAKQMAEVLHYPSNDSMRRASFSRIQNRMNGSDDYDLSSPNKIWPDDDYVILQSFIDLIREFYFGGIETVDYEKTEVARERINQWIEEQTNDRIRELIPEGALDQNVKVVLTNAIYFLGQWMYEFNKKETENSNFHLSSGANVMVPTMSMRVEEGLNYYADEKLQALELPYKGGNLSMTILLPKTPMPQLEATLSGERIEKIEVGMKKTAIDVYLPRFEMTTDYSLSDPLKNLGMTDAFIAGKADLSGMDGTKDLYVCDVLHKAFVKVDEEGTEAAAATAVIIGITGIDPTPEPVFKADHPFMFYITEKTTGSILFLGKVEDPR